LVGWLAGADSRRSLRNHFQSFEIKLPSDAGSGFLRLSKNQTITHAHKQLPDRLSSSLFACGKDVKRRDILRVDRRQNLRVVVKKFFLFSRRFILFFFSFTSKG
jgi:hypothetical protein